MGLLHRRAPGRAGAAITRRNDGELSGVAGGGRDPQGQHLPPRLSAGMAGGAAGDAGSAGLPGAGGPGVTGAKRDE